MRLGRARVAAGQHLEALLAFQRAQAVFERSVPPDGGALGCALHGMAAAHEALGDDEDAMRVSRQVRCPRVVHCPPPHHSLRPRGCM